MNLNKDLGRQAGAALFWRSTQLVGVKIVFLARTLVLAWLLVPEDFGLLVISTIAVDVLLSVTNLGVIPALVQRREPTERQYDTAWTLGMLRAAVISLGVFLAAPLIANLFAEPRAVNLIRVVAFRPVLEAAVSIRVAELTRNLEFRRVALIYLPEALANAIVAIALAPFWGVWALVAGALAGPAALTLASYLLAPHRPHPRFDLRAARPLIQFGRWIFFTSLAAVAGSAMVQLVIARKLGASALGLYFVAAKLALAPAEIAAEVVGAVTFPLYSRLQESAQKVAQAFRAAFVGVAALLFPICALLIALSPSLVENLLGARWEGTASVIRILALVNVVGLLGDTVSPALKGLGSPSSLLLVELVQTSLLLALIWGLADSFGITGAALAWLAAVGATQLLCGFLLLRRLPGAFSGVGPPLVAISAISLLGGLTAYVVDSAISGIYGFAAGCAAGAALMAGLLWLSDRSWRLGIADNAGLVLPRLAARLGAAAPK